MIKYLNRTNRFKRAYRKLSGTHKLKGKLEECLAFDLANKKAGAFTSPVTCRRLAVSLE